MRKGAALMCLHTATNSDRIHRPYCRNQLDVEEGNSNEPAAINILEPADFGIFIMLLEYFYKHYHLILVLHLHHYKYFCHYLMVSLCIWKTSIFQAIYNCAVKNLNNKPSSDVMVLLSDSFEGFEYTVNEKMRKFNGK